jgi:predicted nucleic acid-binding protein
MTLVDANVLLDLFTADDEWKDWSRDQLRAVILQGGAAVNPIVYAEVSLAFAHERELEAELKSLGIGKLPLPYEAAFPAGRAYLRYRRRGGRRRSPLPDFYIGAHAETLGLPLLTRDPRRYRAYFPSVTLIAPRV